MIGQFNLVRKTLGLKTHTMKALLALSISLVFISAFSQDILIPDQVSTNAGQFNSTCPVENLIGGLTPLTDEATGFAYEVTSSFTSSGIGYISSSTLGVLTFEFNSPVEVADMIVWNAYFTIEINHSINSCELFYFDDLNNNLGSDQVIVPIANLANEQGFLIPLTTTANVSKIELHVNSLHGGNEISLRRIAFKGNSINEGCTDSEACNYEPTATIEDGSCEDGACTDSSACNFDSTSSCDDGSCVYADCDCGCVDLNDNDVCDIAEVMGCTDSTAVNYHVIFSLDDGSCLYLNNLCGESTVWDEASGTCVGIVDPCPADFDQSGIVSTSDLLIFLTMFGSEC